MRPGLAGDTIQPPQISAAPRSPARERRHSRWHRFIQSIQVECLDHFLVFGEKHFDYLVREYVEHYHQERPHQGLENRLLSGEPPPAANGDVRCHTRLGGLLKHYHRVAA